MDVSPQARDLSIQTLNDVSPTRIQNPPQRVPSVLRFPLARVSGPRKSPTRTGSNLRVHPPYPRCVKISERCIIEALSALPVLVPLLVFLMASYHLLRISPVRRRLR